MNQLTVWEQIVTDKARWIGGRCGEYDPMFGAAPEGIITDIRLVHEGAGWMFYVDAEGGGFSVNTEFHGFIGGLVEGRLCITGTYGGASTFWIDVRKEKTV